MAHPSTGPLPSGGKVLPITRWTSPLLHRPLTLVTTFDETLTTLVADMVATMYAADGMGLAASQAGVDLQVFVYDCPNPAGENATGVVCNPTLEVLGVKSVKWTEGCLSLPGPWGECERADSVVVRGVSERNEPVEVRGTGKLAMCLQHEYDHLQGTVFGDRVSEKARQRLWEEYAGVKENFPDDWPMSPQTGGKGAWK